jgi:hypothetical protein
MAVAVAWSDSATVDRAARVASRAGSGLFLTGKRVFWGDFDGKMGVFEVEMGVFDGILIRKWGYLGYFDAKK